LAHYLRVWKEASPSTADTDFVFPSRKKNGSVPVCASVFVRNYLRPAALAAGIQIPDGYRFGLHNLRHSLSNWLVNRGKVDPKTVQEMLRHAKVQTTLDLYTQGDNDNKISAQDRFCGLIVDQEAGSGSRMRITVNHSKNGGDDGTRTRGLCRDRVAGRRN
jgi:integrase